MSADAHAHARRAARAAGHALVETSEIVREAAAGQRRPIAIRVIELWREHGVVLPNGLLDAEPFVRATAIEFGADPDVFVAEVGAMLNKDVEEAA